MYKKFLSKFFFITLFLTTVFVTSQEVLLSETERYYDFLTLQGLSERPYLNYRTLSDSVWDIKEEAIHLWQSQNLGTKFKFLDAISLRIYGPELFTSFNTTAPYGQNDGALWQGTGLNSSFTTGARLEGYGVELTFKPLLAFSQNQAFDYIQPNSAYAAFTDKAAVYGYYGVSGIDAPQRFGDEPFFVFDWGDSEVRYTWNTLTIGFGTQTIWLGPAQLNPIIHSNNAPSYPKLDIGIRKQEMILPWLNWYIGDIEARAWWGYLSESDHFDNDTSNNHNLIAGIAIAYGVPFLPGLSIGFNRTMLSKWDTMYFQGIITLLTPFMQKDAGHDENDQRASVVLDYLFPSVGLDIYLEWGKNDYSPSIEATVKYPFHTEGFTLGIKKTLPFSSDFCGEILLEVTKLECSQDYDRLIPWYSTFYAHHVITQGYTNQGQWLGAGIGTGGNSQYLGFKLYFPKGHGQLFVQRRNPDLDYTYYIDSRNPDEYNAEWNIRTFLDFGISGLYFVTRDLRITSSLVFRDEYNPLNRTSTPAGDAVHRYNVHVALGVQYSF
jgi:hypothetical protein